MDARKRSLTIVVLALLAGPLLSCGAGPPTALPTAVPPTATPAGLQLRLNLRPGDVLSLRQSAEQEISQTIQGQQIDLNQTFLVEFAFAVQGVDPAGVVSIDCTFERLSYRMEQGSVGLIEFDTANPSPDADPTFAAILGGFVGQSFSVQFAPNGELVALEGVDEMLYQIMDQVGMPAGAQRESLVSQFGNLAQEQALQNVMPVYPEAPIWEGSSWAGTTEFALLSVQLSDVWTLLERSGGVATLQVGSTVEPAAEANVVETAGMRMIYHLSGDQEGTIEVDEATGWPVRSELITRFTGEVEAVEVPGFPQGFTWPISVYSRITVEQLER